MASKIKLLNSQGSTATLENNDSNLNDYTIDIAKITKSVDTVEDLASLTDAVDTVIVKDKDRGGIFNAISSTTANNGTIFDGNGCSWERQYDGVVNVKWFGAKGDGVTDDTVALISSNSIIQDNTTIYFPDGIYLISHLGFSTFTSMYGNSVFDIVDKDDITIKADNATIKCVGHDISTYGGLSVFKFLDSNTFNVSGLEFDMTFTGVKDSVSFYPICGAIWATNTSSADGQASNDLIGNINIYDCKFKLYHPKGSYHKSNNPISGDDNNGFKIYSITLLGANGANTFNESSNNVVVRDCIFKKGHNAYGIWVWAFNNAKITRITGEDWVSKATEADGVTITSGTPMIRNQQFYGTDLTITDCFFRSKPSGERTTVGFEGGSRFIHAVQNLTSTSTIDYGSTNITNNTIIHGHGDDANTLVDYIILCERNGETNISNNNIDGQDDSGNRYAPDPSVSGIINTAIYVDLSKDSAANGISNVVIANNIFGKFCKMDNILIENKHDTAEIRNCKSAVITGNVSYSQYSRFFGNSRFTGTANGIEKLIVSNNTIDGVNSIQDSNSIYSIGLYLASEATDQIIVSSNIVNDKHTFINDALVNASADYQSFSNTLQGQTISHTTRSNKFNIGEITDSTTLIEAKSSGNSQIKSIAGVGSVTLYAQASNQYVFSTGPLNLYAEGGAVAKCRVNRFTPAANNTVSLGEASLRWSTVYAGTGTINTSDDREKTYLTIDEAETLVAKELKGLVKKFKFNDAIEAKGEDARIHYGTSAQSVMAVFESHGLDPMKYAMICYDEWEEEKDEDGNMTQEAGNRYGIRYEELLCFIIGAM